VLHQPDKMFMSSWCFIYILPDIAYHKPIAAQPDTLCSHSKADSSRCAA
jgi:hypothetical protein